jgi:hypothetical protein
MERRHKLSKVTGEDLAMRAEVRITASVSHPTGGAARDPHVLLNETAHRLHRHPLEDFDQRHTYDGQNRSSGPDWYILEFPAPVQINCLEMTMGFAFQNGGWWTALAVEVLGGDGCWQSVERLSVVPPYPSSDDRAERRPFETYTFTFEVIVTRAVRLIGQPGGLDQFTSLARIAVYHRDLSRWRPESYLGSRPMPEVFRLIAPQIVWDLSASLRKLTGLTINLPSMEFYLDANRYQQYWQAMQHSYQGKPELWFLIGEAIGWDSWNSIDGPLAGRGAPEPHVRLSFHKSLARAVAPILVGGVVQACR